MTKIKLSTNTSNDMEKIANATEWCAVMFDRSLYPYEQGYIWGYIGLGEFKFQHEEDAVLFALRWT